VRAEVAFSRRESTVAKNVAHRAAYRASRASTRRAPSTRREHIKNPSSKKQLGEICTMHFVGMGLHSRMWRTGTSVRIPDNQLTWH
jgi:hypothetical protein